MYDARSRPTLVPARKFRAVKLKEVPGALALGLLAALAAHSATFADHAMGGAYHDALLAIVAFALMASLSFVVSFAWKGAGRILDGSVLASCLRQWLPRWPALAAAAALWFTLGESIEAHHASAPTFLVILALAMAAWLILALARAIISTIAAIAIAIRSAGYAPHVPTWPRRAPAVFIARSLLRSAQRYVRPPPFAVTGA